MTGYRVPLATVRVEQEVNRSRFIATLTNADTVEAARSFIAAIRAEMPDASCHAYAFKIGYGSSVTEGLSDGGEPTGTAGPPMMAVLRGAEVGDTVLVVTRYFGGIKLGTGGLVRAFGDAARTVLAAMTTHEKIAYRQVGLTIPYALYERLKLLLPNYRATIDEESFEAEITLYLTMPLDSVELFTATVRDLSAGRVIPMSLSD
ncbi:MAG: YigZ family protein [Chloroflexota bacterium]